ncbi:metallophosphoesterase family protein [Prosthecomicrobium pneumaticum]|uniref:DNA repair exonuclease SbcCD nuclease subunit n=1 Tax=Prosthecomicrobium pneumaticum TaxID=81895 RepID=A0A7W9FML3_9HYPH|nr:DNA repair exonuclease [Prosthecomicrobium pneumaticum]MBB5753356.1 DNA repair exonuclease SbcCD nuclease subunit [Prosthecomicrobium pneumaticum]
MSGGPGFRFLHAADLHLDSPLEGLARRGAVGGRFAGASRRALENLVEAAIEERVAFVVIAGDVFDGDWRDYATGQFLIRQMARLARAAIPVFAVRGNHDAENVITKALPPTTGYRLFGVRAAETVRLEGLGVALHGRSFAQRHVPENVVLGYPPAVPGWFNIGVLHTSLDGREGHGAYAPCTVDDLRRRGYDYWALGHVHARELVAQDPPILFPGNLQGRHARETGPKGATLVTVEAGRVVAMKALTLDAARFDHIRVDVSGLAGRPALYDRLRGAIAAAFRSAEGRPLALRVTLEGAGPLHGALAGRLEQTQEEVQALAFESDADLLIEKLVDRTEPPGGAERAIAVPGFEAALAEAAADPLLRAALAETLATLAGRLPREALDATGLGQEAGDADAAIGAALALLRAALAGPAGADGRTP